MLKQLILNDDSDSKGASEAGLMKCALVFFALNFLL